MHKLVLHLIHISVETHTSMNWWIDSWSTNPRFIALSNEAMTFRIISYHYNSLS